MTPIARIVLAGALTVSLLAPRALAQGESPAQTGFPWSLVVGADPSTLDEAGRQRVERWAEQAPNYHGCRGTVAECLNAESPDPVARRLAGFLVRRVQAGDSDEEIEARLLARRLSARPRAVAEIDVESAACLGPEEAAVTVVEFADFECPFCRVSSPLLESIARDGDGEVRFCFKHFPLRSHARSVPTAVAAWSAHRQGLFWEMHDALYETAPDLSDAAIDRAARQAGLDLEQLRRDQADDAVAEEIMADKVEGLELGVDRTPSIFINGKYYVGDISEVELRDRIAEELEMLR